MRSPLEGTSSSSSSYDIRVLVPLRNQATPHASLRRTLTTTLVGLNETRLDANVSTDLSEDVSSEQYRYRFFPVVGCKRRLVLQMATSLLVCSNVVSKLGSKNAHFSATEKIKKYPQYFSALFFRISDRSLKAFVFFSSKHRFSSNAKRVS